ncbi:TrkA C-terminal domain-containing protein, partial [Streptomyces californicus]|uniref:TrkA C-terminal domain-containing protein n=1 Tax=Streptomyces californicus TaxID=67351 RepID=UPI00296F9DE4
SDLVLVVGVRSEVIEAGRGIGQETAGIPGLDTPLATKQVSLTGKDVQGRTIAQLIKEHPDVEREGRGVYVTDVTRNDQDIPASSETVLHRGDVVTLVGARSAVGRLVKRIGSEVKNDAADFIYIGFGIVAGSLLGQIVVHFGDVPMSLGTGGGCLIS